MTRGSGRRPTTTGPRSGRSSPRSSPTARPTPTPTTSPPTQARALWMEQPPGLTVVLEDDGRVLGTAKMGPNRPGRGRPRRHGVVHGRPGGDAVAASAGRLATYVVAWHREQGYRRHPVQRRGRDQHVRGAPLAGRSASRSSAPSPAPSARPPRPRRPARDVPPLPQPTREFLGVDEEEVLAAPRSRHGTPHPSSQPGDARGEEARGTPRGLVRREAAGRRRCAWSDRLDPGRATARVSREGP